MRHVLRTGNGFDDLFVVNYNTPNFLYRNLGNGRFEQCAESHGVADALRKIGAVAGDLDGDGDIDLYIPVFAGGVSNILLLNRGDGPRWRKTTPNRFRPAGCEGSSRPHRLLSGRYR